jgi:hypothetical protein
LAAAAGLPWVVSRRRVMPRALEAARELLDELAPIPGGEL